VKSKIFKSTCCRSIVFFTELIFFFFTGITLSSVAQTPLQYQLNQQGAGNCPGTPVNISISTGAGISTTAVSAILSNSALSGGNIGNDGGNAITQRGLCWSTTPNPTTANSISSNGSGLGSYSSNLTGLSPNTLYYVRAYAINSAGTFYGDELSFTTSTGTSGSATHSCGATNVHNPNLTYGSMTDQDGNTYKTIVIGTQEWMAENLKASHYRNGNAIPVVTNNTSWQGLTTGATCWYNNDSATYNCPYGKLYNWYAAVDARNLCPAGWHVPTNAEWNTLIGYLDPSFNPNGGVQSVIAGGKMKSTGTYYWTGPNTAADNSSGFSGLPGGYRTGWQSYGVGYFGIWWSSTGDDYEDTYDRLLGYDSGVVYRNPWDKLYGFSVRCLRD
jgi:uncharacterized protein (TIGR02145 family)